jgi:hypothetical protein
MDKRIILIDGFAPNNPDPEAPENKKVLDKLDIEILTKPKSDKVMKANPETALEKRLAEMFPYGGTNTSSDEFFVVRCKGWQYLLVIHYGQWFVGDNALDEKRQEVVNFSGFEMTEPLLLDATVRFKDDGSEARYTFALFKNYPEGTPEDEKVFFHCETFEDFLGLTDPARNEDFTVIDYTTETL